MPDYYDVIKEPVALSTLKAKLLTKQYKSFSEYVRDCALISHNAQTYNRPKSGAYQDAVVLRREFEKEFKALADQGLISQEVATYPDLGELPPVESPLPLEDEEEDDVDDEEDDEEDEEESDEDGPKRKRKRGPRSTAAITKREGGRDDGGLKGNDAESRKRRGRPPRVDTPMESRIKAVLKAIRKYKNEHGNIIIHQFEKLPDKSAMPEYYMEIKEPIAIEQIKVRGWNSPSRCTGSPIWWQLLKLHRESKNERNTNPLITSCAISMSCLIMRRAIIKMRARSTKTPYISRCVLQR